MDMETVPTNPTNPVNTSPQSDPPEKKSKVGIIVVSVIAVVLLSGVATWALIMKKNIPPVTSPDTTSGSDSFGGVFVEELDSDELPGTTSVITSLPEKLNALGFTPKLNEVNVTTENAVNLAAMEKDWTFNLTDAEKKYLNTNKFVLIPLKRSPDLDPSQNFDEMLTAFDQIKGENSPVYREPQNAKLVNPDIVLHAYHRFFELTLEELEQRDLATALKQFLTDISNNLNNAFEQAPEDLKPAYSRLLAEITVPRVLLENQSQPPEYFGDSEAEQAYKDADTKIDSLENAKNIFEKYKKPLSSELQKAVIAELTSIYDASEVGKSPLFGIYDENLSTDYTQFTPRSHYTKNSALRAYFRAMMYLGRSSYNLKEDIGFIDSNLLTREFMVKSKSGRTPYYNWKKIMDVTGFYAGQSDDITYQEWQDFLKETLTTVDLSTSQLADKETIQKLVQNIKALRLPKILSDLVVYENIGDMTKADLLRNSLSYRIMGQRFTFDAWILNNLSAGQEKTEVKLPSTPTALFLPAVFGSERAKEQLKDWFVENKYSDAEQEVFMSKAITGESAKMEKIKPAEWFASLQSAWVYTLQGITGSYGVGYPVYMQKAPYLDKQIETYLGSYTELKHDTLLYAKQSYSEMGGGGGDDVKLPPVPKGFVEPNILFWRKLLFLVDYSQKLFADHHIFVEHSASNRLAEFKKNVAFYLDIAESELQGKEITEDQYEELRKTDLGYMAQPFSGDLPDDESAKVGLIADIHTDGIAGQILYEANAEPYLMIALVGNESSPRAVIGLAYNHYELVTPIGKRITDEDWKKDAYATPPKLPAKNTWYASLIVK